MQPLLQGVQKDLQPTCKLECGIVANIPAKLEWHCCKHCCKSQIRWPGARCPGHSNCMGATSILCGCALLHVALPFKLRFLALLYIALPFKLRFFLRMQMQGYISILICNNGCDNGHPNLQQRLQQSQHQCLDFFLGGLQQWLQG